MDRSDLCNCLPGSGRFVVAPLLGFNATQVILKLNPEDQTSLAFDDFVTTSPMGLSQEYLG